MKGAYRRFGPSVGSWVAYVGQQFDAGRPPPSRSNDILPHNGSDGKHFFAIHVASRSRGKFSPAIAVTSWFRETNRTFDLFASTLP